MVCSDCVVRCAAKTQRMKQVVPKNDKKKRKEMTQEIERLETEIKDRHDQQLKEFDAHHLVQKKLEPSQPSELELQLKAMQIRKTADEEEDKEASGDEGGSNEKRASKAQKRREKKEREQREREERAAQDEKEGVNHVRQLEQEQLNKIIQV